MPIDRKIQSMITVITESIKEVPQEYYKLRTTYNSEGIVRERIFCYELYHRMRVYQESENLNDVFTLHGEIDKSGHREFLQEDRKNPDFVFHIPGEMSNNAVVLEVKGKFNIADTVKDFETLERFTTEYQYKKGIYLFYNYTKNEIVRNLQGNSTRIYRFLENEKISILCKKSANSQTEKLALIDLRLESTL